MRYLILCLLPLCVAWNGVEDGRVEWVQGEGKSILEQSEQAFRAGAHHDGRALYTVAVIDLPGRIGDGVIGIWARDAIRDEGWVELPDPDVAITYEEYNTEGAQVFLLKPSEIVGRIKVETTWDDSYTLAFDLRMSNAHNPNDWRGLSVEEAELSPIEVADVGEPPRGSGGYGSSGSSGGYVGVHSSGCEGGSDWEDDDDGWESSGCEGDDWDSGDSSNSGCEGDDWDSGDSSGGCEGDSGGSSGCEGDALASGTHHRRSPLIMRAINWTPWMILFLAIRLMRRREDRVS